MVAHSCHRDCYISLRPPPSPKPPNSAVLVLSDADNMYQCGCLTEVPGSTPCPTSMPGAVRRRDRTLGKVRRVPNRGTVERPHGLSYSLTLHVPDRTRLVGFDNAHPARDRRGPGTRRHGEHDHRHRLRTIRPYDHKDALTLLEDLWKEVDAVLKERGAIQ